MDGRLAPALQKGLERLAKPWYRRRALRVFRDQTSLSATPHLWSTIQDSLAASRYFVVLASPEAARSQWVGREVGYWRENRPSSNLLIALTDGDIVWVGSAGDFDWDRTTALPPALQAAFGEEPLYVDLRWARTAEDLSLRNPLFAERVADLAAPVHGQPKDELIGDDVRQHRRTMRLARAAVLLLVSLVAVASVLAVIASVQRGRAIRQAHLAESRQLAATALSELSVDPEISALLARRAGAIAVTRQATDALRESLGQSHLLAVIRPRTGPVAGAAFSPDGKQVLTWSATGGNVRLWDSATGAPLSFRVHLGGCCSVATAFFTRTGDGVITTADVPGPGSTKLWDVRTGRELRSFPGSAVSKGLSPNGALLVTVPPADFSAGIGGSPAKPVPLHVWNVPTGKQVELLRFTSDPPSAAAFDPTGTYVVGSALAGKTGHIWNVRTGKESTFGLPAHPAGVATLSPDGSRLAYDSPFVDNAHLSQQTVTVLGPGPRVVATLQAPDGEAIAGFSPDSSLLATTDADEVGIGARIWDARNGQLITSLQGDSAPIDDLRFSPDGTFVATASADGTARLWDPHTGQLYEAFRGDTGGINTVAFSPDGRRVVTASTDGTARVWDAAVGLPDRILAAASANDSFERVEPSLDGRFVLAVGGKPLASDPSFVPNGDVHLWSTAGGPEPSPYPIGGGDVQTAHFSPDGKQIVTVGSTDVTVWDRATGREIRTLPTGPSPFSARFSPDGTRILTEDREGATVWSAADGHRIAHVARRTDSFVFPMLDNAIFSPDGSQAFLPGSGNRDWAIWNLRSGKLIHAACGGAADGADTGAFAPDGRTIAVASPSYSTAVTLCDARTGRRIHELKGHIDPINSFAFSPDGSRLVDTSGYRSGQDNTARVWDVATGKQLLVLAGHRRPVTAAAYSPDGRWIVTGSEDGTGRIWNASSGDLVEVLRGDNGFSGGVAFAAPDAVFAAGIGSVQTYTCRLCGGWEALARLADRTLVERLTPAEAARFEGTG